MQRFRLQTNKSAPPQAERPIWLVRYNTSHNWKCFLKKAHSIILLSAIASTLSNITIISGLNGQNSLNLQAKQYRLAPLTTTKCNAGHSQKLIII